jgi:hypothetical protein
VAGELLVGHMTIRGFLRGLRIYVRGWRPPPHIVFGLMFGVVGVAYGGRFTQGFILGVLLSGCWEYAMRKGWIRREDSTSSPK